MESREENLKNNKVFEVLQRVGRSFMLPIAILPVAGLFLGIGSSFTNETMLKAYGLYGIMGPGTIIHGILTVMSAAGPANTADRAGRPQMWWASQAYISKSNVWSG